MRTATITTSRSAITHNLQQVKRYAPNAKVLAMVKAGAYGHGVASVLPALQAADGIGVASFEEALEARQLGWDKTVGLVEGVFSADEWQQAIAHDFSCVIHHLPQLDWALSTIAPEGSATRNVWLKYNTGMNRLGFDDDMVIKVAHKLHNAGYHLILTTHFANADDQAHPLNSVQIERFETMLGKLQREVDAQTQGSLCNSAGVVNFTEHHHDWVRPGIMLYGSSPVTDKSAADLALKPTMDFRARIMALQTVNKGDTVGYGSRWTAMQQTQTALVSIGYGDGYPRVLNDDAYVCVIDARDHQRYRCPIRGRVAMDMIVIDISAAPRDIAIDSDVVLWGESPHIDEVALHAGTIGYELMCRLGARPARLTAL